MEYCCWPWSLIEALGLAAEQAQSELEVTLRCSMDSGRLAFLLPGP